MAVIFICVQSSQLYAQVRNSTLSTKQDSLRKKNNLRVYDSLTVALDDSLKIADSLNTDTTIAKDTVAKTGIEERLCIRLSPNALPGVVTSSATDSAVLNTKKNIYYLYGNAQVKYEDMQLNAGKVIFDQGGNMVTAAPASDSAVSIKDKPSFTQGQEKVSYDSMQYNFKSKRAIIRNAHSQYGEGFVHSTQVKRNPDQSIYGLHNVYTTCALDTPHFGILSRKIKVIPGKVAATGPANLMVMQVPTPLFLPFGLFPIAQGQHSGFIIPTYIIEPVRGLGLVSGGYYFALSDHSDLQTHANFYSKGSWSADFLNTYKYSYRYYGSLFFSYAYNKTGESYEPGARPTKDFKIKWDHHSDPKAKPLSHFDATVDAGTNTYNQNNTYTVDQILQNQFSSSIAYSKAWQNKPYSLGIAARHAQNTRSKLVDITLPDVTFSAQFSPFQRKNSVGTKWYEKISINYQFTGRNQTSFYDSLFSFRTLGFNDFQNEIVHKIPLSANYTVARFVTLNFNLSYTEYWLSQRMYRAYNYATERVDTLSLTKGFYAARDFNAGMGLNTRIYGTKLFKHGKIAGLRHELRPNVSINYIPDYAAAPFRYGYKTILDPKGRPQYVSAYEGAIIATPSNQFGDFSSALTFGLDNVLQMKTRSAKDTSGFRKVNLIDNFRISSGYDIAKDSFNWFPVSMHFNTNIVNIISINADASFDPYGPDTSGRLMKRTLYDQGKGLARFTNARIGVDGGFHSKPKNTTNDPAVKTDEYKRLMEYGRFNDYTSFNIPWNFRFSYTLLIAKNYVVASHKDTVTFDHYTGFNGDFNLTPKWKVTFSSGYNFTQKQLQITQIGIIRDLHCWQMSMNMVPFGRNRYYTFTLNAKATVLQDLKLLKRKDYHDAVY